MKWTIRPPRSGGSYAYLMQFADGNRIDLTLFPIAQAQTSFKRQPDPSAAGQRRASLSLSRRRATGIICPNRQPPKNSPIAATNSGGLARTLPRACGGENYPTQNTCWMTLCGPIGENAHLVDRREDQFLGQPGQAGEILRAAPGTRVVALLLATYSDADYERTWEALFCHVPPVQGGGVTGGRAFWL